MSERVRRLVEVDESKVEAFDEYINAFEGAKIIAKSNLRKRGVAQQEDIDKLSFEKLNEFLGHQPDNLTFEQIHQMQLRSSNATAFRNVPSEWLDFNKGLSMIEKYRLTVNSASAIRKGITDLGMLRNLTVEQIAAKGLSKQVAIFLANACKRPES